MYYLALDELCAETVEFTTTSETGKRITFKCKAQKITNPMLEFEVSFTFQHGLDDDTIDRFTKAYKDRMIAIYALEQKENYYVNVTSETKPFKDDEKESTFTIKCGFTWSYEDYIKNPNFYFYKKQ